MKTIIQDVKNKSFKRVYLLYGEEAYLRRSYKNKLQEAICGDDTMNYQYFEGKGLDFATVKDFVETMPFFADYRLAVVEDSGLFSSTAEEWAEYVANIPETSVLIFVEEKIDKRNKLYKAVTKAGYAAELARPGENDLKRWVAQMCRQNGKNITEHAAEEFVMRTAENMEQMKSEFDKLMTYVGERAEVYPQDVEAICTERLDNQIFRMMDAMAEGKEKIALDLYYDLLALKEPPMRILFLIGRHINQLLQTRELVAAGAGRDAVASRCKVMPFAATKLINQCKAFSKEQLRSYVALCVDSDEAIKTGRLQEKMSVELALLTIARREKFETVKIDG